MTVPLEGIAIEASSSYLRSVKTSDTSLVQVIEQIIQDDSVRADAFDMKLTAEASELLGRDLKTFTDKYGEYFVYGHVSRARFTAVCNIKTRRRMRVTRSRVASWPRLAMPKASPLHWIATMVPARRTAPWT